jgi:DNA polymerase-1
VHTSFNQSITTTGRLSSSRPNLQNIPTRTELGMEIRKAFVAPEGYVLAGFDYSQIELRLMAHFAQDQKMIADFAAGRDIHAATAMRVFKLDALEDVTSSQRSIAKAVNFATLYGAGARTLAENAGVSYEEARSFMEEYFQEYPTVSQYIEQLVETAKQKGYAETMFGRRLSLPDLQSKMPQVQKAAERIAVNMPLQGTAADIMKKAMISVCDFVEQRTPDVWIILQVHDDLVLEIKEDRADELIPQIQQLIEADMHLSVPLQVDVKVGKNWGVMEKRSR